MAWQAGGTVKAHPLPLEHQLSRMGNDWQQSLLYLDSKCNESEAVGFHSSLVSCLPQNAFISVVK